MNKLCKICLLLLVALCLTACTHVANENLLANHKTPDELVVILANDITALSTTIDPKEAFGLANTAINATYNLANRYGMSGPPEYHNVMVNLGIRERGLCWHWTTDLLNAFFSLGLTTIDFMWAEANAGSELSEHNVAVIVPKSNMRLENGLVYDPWRTSGKPFWIRVVDDTKYPWVELPREKW